MTTVRALLIFVYIVISSAAFAQTQLYRGRQHEAGDAVLQVRIICSDENDAYCTAAKVELRNLPQTKVVYRNQDADLIMDLYGSDLTVVSLSVPVLFTNGNSTGSSAYSKAGVCRTNSFLVACIQGLMEPRRGAIEAAALNTAAFPRGFRVSSVDDSTDTQYGGSK